MCEPDQEPDGEHLAYLDAVLTNAVDLGGDLPRWKCASNDGDVDAMLANPMLGCYASVGSDFVLPSVSLQPPSLRWCGFGW